MRILVADDHALVRRGMIQVLANAHPGTHFGEAGTARETLDAFEAGPWDLLVLDIFMPDRSGLEVLRTLRLTKPAVPVLVVSSAPEEQMAVRVLKAGARGYLNKQAAPEELVIAVRRIRLGRRYVSDAISDRLAGELSEGARPPHERLSDREFEVLQSLLAGKSIKDIADELGLSPKTISTFHTRLWEKLGVQNDVELVRYAMEQHLAGLPGSV